MRTHRRPANALSPREEAQLIELMMSTRFAHLSPKQLVPQLADRGLYLASESTFYRLQRRHGLRGRRRVIARTDVSRATRLHRAVGPNQVWSWDITWLATTIRGVYLHLYLVLDVWSRRIVGWCIAERGSAEIAAELITHACREGNFDPKGLVLHSEIADARSFDNGRQVSAWLGLVPRQNSSGGKSTLLGISKRGDVYLRTLLIHGARSAILAARRRNDNKNGWLANLLNRRHPNLAAVALANKNVRTVWALLAHGRNFNPNYVPARAAT